MSQLGRVPAWALVIAFACASAACISSDLPPDDKSTAPSKPGDIQAKTPTSPAPPNNNPQINPETLGPKCKELEQCCRLVSPDQPMCPVVAAKRDEAACDEKTTYEKYCF
jgi:hypothetical protein